MKDDPKRNTTPDKEVFVSLFDFITQCQLFAFSSMSGLKDCSVVISNEIPQKHAQTTEVVYLLLASDEFHVTLRALFSENTQQFAQKRLPGVKVPDGEAGRRIALDFISEVCNLTAGVIQRKLAFGISLWLSLPYTKPWYEDSAFNGKASQENVPRCYWHINTPEGPLYFSADVFLANPDVLPPVNLRELLNLPDEGTMLL